VQLGNLGEYKNDILAQPIFEALWAERFTLDLDADEATTHYSISRWVNTCKLAISIAASRSDPLVIEKKVVEETDDMTHIHDGTVKGNQLFVGTRLPTQSGPLRCPQW